MNREEAMRYHPSRGEAAERAAEELLRAWPDPPPYDPDYDLIGYIEEGQRR